MAAEYNPNNNDADHYRSFLSLSEVFQRMYFEWHTAGQYEGVQEFRRFEDVLSKPPRRERDDWYSEELRVIDTFYRSLKDSRVLEIGCGDGNITWKLAGKCKALTSCDLDPAAIELTKVRMKDMGLSDKVQLFTGSVQNLLPDKQESYDVVFFVQVLEHVPSKMQAELFDNAFSLVAPGGCLYVSTPNRWAIRDSHDTGKLFIHWFPRWIKVPVARALGWGIKGVDPAWSSAPVLHDYVSFRWMLRRAKASCQAKVNASEMLFYPDAAEWLKTKKAQGCKGKKYVLQKMVGYLGKYLPLNYYFGDKVIFSKARNYGKPEVIL